MPLRSIIQTAASSARNATMTTHELKSWPDFFTPIFDGSKMFDLRYNKDRNFKVGDTLRLREWNDRMKEYTGRETSRRITHILDGIGPGCIEPHRGLARDYVILSLAAVP